MSAPFALRATRRAVAVLGLAIALSAGAAACGSGDAPRRSSPPDGAATSSRDRGAAWTPAELQRRLAGRRIRVGTRAFSVDLDTVTCLGLGAAAGRRGGRPAYRRFRCIQPTPARRGAVAGPDLVFVVEPGGGGAPAVREARLAAY